MAAKKNEPICIPHNHWAYRVTTASNYSVLIVSAKPMSLKDVVAGFPDDASAIKSVERIDVNLVRIHGVKEE